MADTEFTHVKIKLGKMGYETLVEIDGKPVTNLTGIAVSSDAEGLTEVTLKLVPDEVDVEGELWRFTGLLIKDERDNAKEMNP